MRLESLLVAALLTATGLATADDKAPPAPSVNPIYTPPLPSPSAAAPTLSEEQITAIVDRAITRAMDHQRYSASPQSSPAFATAQGPTVAYAQSVTPRQVHVLVAPGPIKRSLGHLGEKMARLGDPHVRPMTIAQPADVVVPYTPPLPLPSQQAPR